MVTAFQPQQAKWSDLNSLNRTGAVHLERRDPLSTPAPCARDALLLDCFLPTTVEVSGDVPTTDPCEDDRLHLRSPPRRSA
jgi:hypothetical protein